jgi:hypothetical protein
VTTACPFQALLLMGMLLLLLVLLLLGHLPLRRLLLLLLLRHLLLLLPLRRLQLLLLGRLLLLVLHGCRCCACTHACLLVAAGVAGNAAVVCHECIGPWQRAFVEPGVVQRLLCCYALERVVLQHFLLSVV